MSVVLSESVVLSVSVESAMECQMPVYFVFSAAMLSAMSVLREKPALGCVACGSCMRSP